MKQNSLTMVCAGLCLFMAAACTGLKPATPIKSGEQLRVDYTCSIKGKGVVDTTQRAVAQDEDIEKSRVFVALGKYEPLGIRAGMDAPVANPSLLKPLDPQILTMISREAVGKVRGRTYDMTLEAQTPEGMEDNVRYREIKHVRLVPLIKNIPMDQYVFGHKKQPILGEVYSKDGQPYARVVAVTQNSVQVQMLLDKPMYTDSPWGPVRAEKMDDQVKVTIEAQEGMLVRTGDVIGQVLKVTTDKIIVDYGGPFAGYPLQCRVRFLDETEEQTHDDE